VLKSPYERWSIDALAMKEVPTHEEDEDRKAGFGGVFLSQSVSLGSYRSAAKPGYTYANSDGSNPLEVVLGLLASGRCSDYEIIRVVIRWRGETI
jgi:hypothetical protein